MEYTPYLNQGLNNFEDIINLFTTYSDGGYWIKKIDYKDGFYRELIQGPFSRDEADKKAAHWNKIFKYKGLKVATSYSFKELVCQHEDDPKMRNYLDEEYIWKPPLGAELMCLLHGQDNVLMAKVRNENDDNYQKFKAYSLSNGLELMNIEDYLIFYKKNNYRSKEEALVLKKVIKEYKNRPGEIQWLYDELKGNQHLFGKKPIVLPNYLYKTKQDVLPLELEFFKRYEEFKSRRERLENFKKDMERLLNQGQLNLEATGNQAEFSYNLMVVIDKKDGRPKKMNVKISKNKTLSIHIKDQEERYYVRFLSKKGKVPRITFELPYMQKNWKFLIDEIFNGDESFKDIKKIIHLLLYIAKSLGYDDVYLYDNLKEYCKCNQLFDMPIYSNILRFLIGEKSIYEEIGFKETNPDRREEIIKKYKEMVIKNILKKEGLSYEEKDEDDMEEEGLEEQDLYYNHTLDNFVKDYMNGMCQYEYVCQLMNKISKEIFLELKDSCLEYVLYLSSLNLSDLRSLLSET